MSINDIIQATIDAAFSELGVAATYTPLSGPGVSVTVMPNQQTETFAGLGDTDINADINHFDLRVSEVADPDEAQIRDMLSGHLCRCTGYHGMVQAVLEVAARGQKDK